MNNAVEEDLSPNHSTRLILCLWACALCCIAQKEEMYLWSRAIRHPSSAARVFHWPTWTSLQLLRPRREVPGQECNFYHFIIGHTGLSKSCSCSQPNPSTSESSTHSCFVLVLSFHPQISCTCSPGIRLIQGDISFAILITTRCWGKQNISVNEWLRDVNRHTQDSIKAPK